MQATDVELLEAWRGGDRHAGERLFERHFDAVSRFFRNKVDFGVDDLIQRTFLACVESRERIRGDSSFRTFLFAVARNLLRKHYRGKRRHGGEIDFGVTSVHDMGPSPSVVVAEHQEQQLLLQALRRIPLDHQVILELYYWERLTSAEIAEVLGVPHGTARTRIRRAKQLLEEQLRALQSDRGLVESTIANLESWAASLRERLGRPPPA
ncbi:MAG: sigma-70 family RNA polymerase sigma factor [Myxococcales bacterium]|nr:sigma-70 family RNA polymerase sigma factor [Myxococcales bacterium]